MIDVPFSIGDVLWAAGHTPHQIEVPCPICYGQLAIVIILGNGDRVGVNCDGCGHGYDGPRGAVGEWVYDPRAIEFEIEAVDAMHMGRWSVRSTTGATSYYEELFKTEAEALAKARENAERQLETNMASRCRVRGGAKKAGWTARYHLGQIQDLERQLAWHRSKVEMKGR